MNKKKRFIRRFIDHLFGVYNAPRIPIHIHYGYPSLVDPEGNFCFGTYVYEDGELGCIHVAGDVGTTTLMSLIAHEFVHYVQRGHGRDMNDTEAIERDAEYWSAGLMGQWIINKKSARRTLLWRSGDLDREAEGVIAWTNLTRQSNSYGNSTSVQNA